MHGRRFAMLACLSSPAAAEPVIEGFAGRGWTRDTPLILTSDTARIEGQVVPANLRVDVEPVATRRSAIYGLRLGYWFGSSFGVALDAATLDVDVAAQRASASANVPFFEPVFGAPVRIAAGDLVSADIPRITVPTTATIAGLAMLRLPIGATRERPAGLFAPYAFVGPVYLITETDIDGDFGLRAGGGVKLVLTRNVGLFAEYRYTHVNASAVAGRFSGTMSNVTGDTGDITVDVKLRNHAAVGGISLSF